MPDKGHAVSAIRLAKKNRKAGNLSKSQYDKIRRKAHKILKKNERPAQAIVNPGGPRTGGRDAQPSPGTHLATRAGGAQKEPSGTVLGRRYQGCQRSQVRRRVSDGGG